VESQRWHKKSLYHRDKGLPSIIYYFDNEELMSKDWYKNGEFIKEEFYKNGKKMVIYKENYLTYETNEEQKHSYRKIY
jgi:antitoxin component YwqK of YwqJK toxin-antitoxin module